MCQPATIYPHISAYLNIYIYNDIYSCSLSLSLTFIKLYIYTYLLHTYIHYIHTHIYTCIYIYRYTQIYTYIQVTSCTNKQICVSSISPASPWLRQATLGPIRDESQRLSDALAEETRSRQLQDVRREAWRNSTGELVELVELGEYGWFIWTWINTY